MTDTGASTLPSATPHALELQSMTATHRLIRTWRYFLADEQGTTPIEYGMIAFLVSVAAIGIWSRIGNEMTNTWNEISNAYENR